MILPDGNPGGKIMIVGGYPSMDDMSRGKVLADASGWELRKLIKESGISLGEVFFTSVMKQTAGSSDEMAYNKKQITDQHNELNGKWVKPALYSGVTQLMGEIDLVKPKMIIALGDLALWALTGNWGIKKWRGSQLHCHGVRVIPTYHPKEVFAMWELRPIALQDMRTANYYVERDFPQPDWNFHIRPTYGQVIATLETLQDKVETGPTQLSYDIETLAGNISCIGLAWSKRDALCIPFMKMGQPEGYFSEAEEAEIIYRLYRLMTHHNFLGITQNGLFDSQYLYRNWHFMPHHYQDTMISHHVLFPTMQKSLDFICSFHNEQYVYWKDDLKEWRTTIVSNETQYWTYNCEDSARTWEAAASLQTCVDKMGQRVQHDFQQSLFMPAHKMMNRGIDIDYEQMKEMRVELRKEVKRLEGEICYVVGYPLNPRSPVQMQKFFYGEMAQPKQTKRSSKGISISCDSASLAKVAIKEPLLKPLIEIIEQWRSANVYLSSFLEDNRDIDGRMRCSYNITGAVTFRFSSSSNPFNSGFNLQTVPKGEE